MTDLTSSTPRFEVTRRHSSDDRATVVFQTSDRDEAVRYCEGIVIETIVESGKRTSSAKMIDPLFGFTFDKFDPNSWFVTWVIQERSEADRMGIVVNFDEATIVCEGCGDPCEFCVCRDGFLYEDPR